jgi:desulfoferrodoxin (superoxide reductase-like protein)
MVEFRSTYFGRKAKRKHVPLVHEEDGKVYVQVGSVLHPMDETIISIGSIF